MKRWAICLAISLVCAPLPALAAGAYLGGSWLSTSAEFDTAVENFDTDDSGWKVFAGADADKFFGAEVSYRDMGNFTDTQGLDSLGQTAEQERACRRPLGLVARGDELEHTLGLREVEAPVLERAPGEVPWASGLRSKRQDPRQRGIQERWRARQVELRDILAGEGTR